MKSVNTAAVISNAEAIDRRVKDLVAATKSASLELGGLLRQVKDGKLYRQLGHKHFTHYVASVDLSMSYAERVMRAHKIATRSPEVSVLTPDKILFVENVSRRPGNGRTLAQWVQFAHEHSRLDCQREKKRLTRAGILPIDGRAAHQAVRFRDREPNVNLDLLVPPKTKKLFEEQCRAWALTPAATLLKLLIQSNTKGPNER